MNNPPNSTDPLEYCYSISLSAGQGRWASPDPAGLAAVDPSYPQSWNRYAYVLNNPLSNIDPSGEVSCPSLASNACSLAQYQPHLGGDLWGVNSSSWDQFDLLTLAFTPTGTSRSIDTSPNCLYNYDCAADIFTPIYGNISLLGSLFTPVGGYRGASGGKLYLKAEYDCGRGANREIQYNLMLETNGQASPVMSFIVQEQVTLRSGALFNAGAPQGPNDAGFSNYTDDIQGSGTRDTLQTFSAYLPGGPHLNVFARDVYGQDYGTNGIYVVGGHGSHPAQIFVNNHPTPPANACVYPK